jgi:hypothetical protein
VAVVKVTRENVLGYRAWAHGLDRRPGGSDLVLRLGVQDTPHGSARVALAARGVQVDEGEEGSEADDSSLVTVWTWRGGPHRHFRADIPFLAEALWPITDADAQKRITAAAIKDGARRGRAAFTEAASAMRAVVTERLLKGEVSTLVTARIPADLSYDCPTCAARHVSGGLFQHVGLAAGVQLQTQGRNTFLSPLPSSDRSKTVPTQAKGTAEALMRYLELHAPATPAHLAEFLGTTQTAIKSVLPQHLTEVDGPQGRAWTPAGTLPRLTTAEPPRLTRLLPPSDPWLQARDRGIVIPDANHRKAVWGAIGNPGVVLSDGEVTGTWRAKLQRHRLIVTVTAFTSVPAGARAAIETEAALLASIREADEATVVYAD